MPDYGRIPVAELDHDVHANVTPGDVPDLRPAAIFGEQEAMLRICMYCPSKADAEAYCIARNIEMSHGICTRPECRKAHLDDMTLK